MTAMAVALRPWEARVIEAVGQVIDHWGFKFNQGRVWALLYLRDEPMQAAELQELLDLSKGAVSMITRELEAWGVVERTRRGPNGNWHYVANTDFMQMIGRVIRDRERPLIHRVRTDLSQAEDAARNEPGVPRDVLDRIARMRLLADFVDRALNAFMRTSQLDLRDVVGVLKGKLHRSSRNQEH